MSDSDTKQEPPYGLRMPPDLKARVKAAAEANNRSMNAEIVATLEERYPHHAPLSHLETGLLLLKSEMMAAGGMSTERVDQALKGLEQDLDELKAYIAKGSKAD